MKPVYLKFLYLDTNINYTAGEETTWHWVTKYQIIQAYRNNFRMVRGMYSRVSHSQIMVF